MGWGFPWLSSHGSDFNFDYHVSFTDAELKAKRSPNTTTGSKPCGDRRGARASACS